jgi:hypothetical protein
VGRAHHSGPGFSRHYRQHSAGHGAGAGSRHQRLRPASHPGTEHHRRIPVHARGPYRRGRRRSGAGGRRDGPSRPRTARDWKRGQHLPLQCPVLQSGSRPR